MNSVKPALLPFLYAQKNSVVFADDNGSPSIYCATLPKPSIIAEVQRYCATPAAIQLVSEDELAEKLSMLYSDDILPNANDLSKLDEYQSIGSLDKVMAEVKDLLVQDDEGPIIRLINALFAEAIRMNASDIHLDSFEAGLKIRYRVDGELRMMLEVQHSISLLMVSRIKVMAKLDIAEKRLPQDGHISLLLAGNKIDIRVSTLPSIFGERVVLRILDRRMGKLDLTSLGMSEANSARLEGVLRKPHGIFLVTGPTGSGKTTTLYASLKKLATENRNALTIEDPVEFHLAGIGQTQVNTKSGMTFARGLRSILRQDPDIVMIGEIRDGETMEIAVQASLTGHFVLSTLHTNTAIGAIPRLKDMGIDAYLLASSLSGLMAQRLVRILCDGCKEPAKLSKDDREFLAFNSRLAAHNVFQPSVNGCKDCSYQGYKGRTGIYEIIDIDEDMRQLIHDQRSENELIEAARKSSQSIARDGAEKVLAGITSCAEVRRVI